MKIWHSLEIEIARSAEQVVSGQLWLAGTTGIEISEDGPDTLTFRAYFDENQDTAKLRDQILASLQLAGIPEKALRSLTQLDVEDQDWLAEWKKGYSPTPIGDRLLITPSWKRNEVETSDRVTVEIDPGMAFGTGTHETTRGCLEMLDRYWHGGSLLDAGTGTGILAIAAIKLAPGSQVTGFDIDPDAIVVAEANAAINGVSDHITLEVNNVGAYEGEEYDIVVANLTADVLIPLSARFANVVRQGSLLVASGVLLEQENDIVESFTASGFRVKERRPDGEWVTICFQVPAFGASGLEDREIGDLK